MNIASASVDGSIISFLAEDDDVIEVPVAFFENKVPDVEQLEQNIINRCKPTFKIRLTRKGSQVLNVDFAE